MQLGLQISGEGSPRLVGQPITAAAAVLGSKGEHIPGLMLRVRVIRRWQTPVPFSLSNDYWSWKADTVAAFELLSNDSTVVVSHTPSQPGMFDLLILATDSLG